MTRRRSAFVALLLFVGACGSDTRSQTPVQPSQPSEPLGAGYDAPPVDETRNCVSEFSLEGLPDRGFAFDGTVAEVLTGIDPRYPAEEGAAVSQPRARFEVHEWFSGGSDATALVWLQRDVDVGDRLLVSGQPRWGGEPLEDAIQWECGWTVEYSDSRATYWRYALREET